VEGSDEQTIGTFVLNKLKEPIAFRRHAIVGNYDEVRPFVKHTGLLKENQSIQGEEKLSLNHMGPPLNANGSDISHLVGQIELANEEIEAIDDWLASVSTQYRDLHVLDLQQYVVCPHMKWVVSEEGRRIRQRFSCVGYVLEAYRAAEIELISVDNVPLADKEVLLQSYPVFQKIAARPRVSQKLGFKGFDDLGVSGDGPWQVVLAGYLFHAVNCFQQGTPRPEAFNPADLSFAGYPRDVK